MTDKIIFAVIKIKLGISKTSGFRYALENHLSTKVKVLYPVDITQTLSAGSHLTSSLEVPLARSQVHQ